ncbi:MAG TPA: ATP-dependent zinc metalloprotease FtsH [Candidatus Flavonifractor merdipullorum]|uniref:ATP-dependent zinc metalloprotease FtsH n=1 Tax=Candidatus Flavonifractor merdipullorum TaxID=2838590 RepID=A0A9D1RT62_9FIRM|nr:ATP-dependent zinc metalloprotease FtsH [Candidatus Flavonifractor merdipullorum]
MGIISIVVWALIITLFFNYFASMAGKANTTEVMYGQFQQMVAEDKVYYVEYTSGKYTFYLKDDVAKVGLDPTKELDPTTATKQQVTEFNNKLKKAKSYYCAPVADPVDTMEMLNAHGVHLYGTPYVAELSPIISLLISYVLPMAIIMVLFFFLFRSMAGKMGGGLGGVGKANAKVYVEKKTGVTFRDVAGQDEAKESLQEIIDILHNPQKYTEIGAKLPKGALLVGSPGTGKTLLAKAVAGEANVPFFSISGSDFVEMFVGVGASRVRDLFKEASKMAPCIIFIDEIDTIGKSRDNRMGGNDEREQTLNQLLAELDGFDPTKGVIVLAATNRPEVLDKALLRPGRFDRRITVDRPNLAGRLATLQVHTRNIRLAEDVDLNKIAQATAGAVGADLANLVNEAALRAVRLGRRAVNQHDLLTAFETVIAGAEKKGTVLTEQEKKLIAYHEVGHALVAAKQKNAQPVSKITIVPHTQGALGYTMQLPEEEKFLMTRDDLYTEIRTLLGGRSAEEEVFQTMTSGASNDIERATDLARKMVTMFGMSDRFGVMGLATIQNQYLDVGYGLNCAQDTAALIDQEVQAILDRCHQEARQILAENREQLDAVAGYLLEKETITGGEMMAILEGKDPALADNFGDNTGKPAPTGDIEPPARHIHMVSEPPAVPDQEQDVQEEAPQKDEDNQTP